MIKSSRLVKQNSWSKLLRFPIIFGTFLLFAGYSVLNFEDMFHDKLKNDHNKLWGSKVDEKFEKKNIKHNEKDSTN